MVDFVVGVFMLLLRMFFCCCCGFVGCMFGISGCCRCLCFDVVVRRSCGTLACSEWLVGCWVLTQNEHCSEWWKLLEADLQSVVKGMHSGDLDSNTVESSLILLIKVARRYGPALFSYCNRALVDYYVARLLKVPSSHLERKSPYEVGCGERL